MVLPGTGKLGHQAILFCPVLTVVARVILKVVEEVGFFAEWRDTAVGSDQLGPIFR